MTWIEAGTRCDRWSVALLLFSLLLRVFETRAREGRPDRDHGLDCSLLGTRSGIQWWERRGRGELAGRAAPAVRG
jgi:hypothetical protein